MTAPAWEMNYSDAHQFMQDVQDIVVSCRDEGWDGYDATPVSIPAILRTIQFVRSHSGELPIPEVTPEPDGEVSLDWLGREGQSLSLSIGESDKITYAHVLKNNSLYGVMSFAEPDIKLLKSLIRKQG